MKTIRIFGTRGLILATALGVSVGIGVTSPAFAQKLPVIVNPDGKVTYLGTLGGSYSTTYDINDAGQVVGNSDTAAGHDHAFITDPNGMGMRDLGTLGGTSSYALGINNSGQVVGETYTLYGSSYAFVTGPDGMGMRELGSSFGGSSRAYDINDSGQVVGQVDGSHSSIASDAFITDPDGMVMRELSSIADLPNGRFLSNAQGINDQGQVLAIAFVSNIPKPASYALMLAGLGLVGFMTRSKKAIAAH
ncbi:MAG: PEP-CTERM sorting domain-containing protein [Nitrosospira sp.]